MYWYIALSPFYDNQWRNYSLLILTTSVLRLGLQFETTIPNGTTVESNLQKGKLKMAYITFQENKIELIPTSKKQSIWNF